MTSWSQRRRTVTLAVRVRGAVSAEASVEGNKLHFRYLFTIVPQHFYLFLICKLKLNNLD